MSRAWPVDGIEPDGALAANARRILAVRMAEYYSYAPIVHVEEAIQPLHDLRIAAKRLRYTLELFHDVFGEVGLRNVERVKTVQEELGEVHDHDVRVALIDQELASLGAGGQRHQDGLDPLPGLQGLRTRQVAGRRAHYQTFRALWERFAAEGMRAELAALSATPLPGAPGPVETESAVA
jgi:CHAD domain-containing protein